VVAPSHLGRGRLECERPATLGYQDQVYVCSFTILYQSLQQREPVGEEHNLQMNSNPKQSALSARLSRIGFDHQTNKYFTAQQSPAGRICHGQTDSLTAPIPNNAFVPVLPFTIPNDMRFTSTRFPVHQWLPETPSDACTPEDNAQNAAIDDRSRKMHQNPSPSFHSLPAIFALVSGSFPFFSATSLHTSRVIHLSSIEAFKSLILSGVPLGTTAASFKRPR
jgi:hypothetical protein